ncbi:MAG: SDR family oxidoreductase [Planctomycetota bacterium]|nr:SDR family oxidoreductase [Planctomycetota bacterium]
MFTLQGKRAMVCGSTQGLGRGCAEELARAGAEIVLVARNEETLEKTRDALATDHGQNHEFIVADFSDHAGVRESIRVHLDSTSHVQILVNNTGGPPAGPANEADPEAFLSAFKQHLLCNQALVQETLPGMKEAGYGRVINIISTSVVIPVKGLGVSNTIRGAVANWARTLASELAPFGITVNNVLPGFFDTVRLHSIIATKAGKMGVSVPEMEKQMQGTVPMERFGTPEEMGAVVAFLASPGASYVNGVNLLVDGGRLAAS